MNVITASPQPDEGERLNRLRLIRSDGVGPRTFFTLLKRCGNAGRALDYLAEALKRGERSEFGLAKPEDVAQEVDRAARKGIRFLMFDEVGYPEALRVLDDAPPILAVRGSLEILRRPMVSIVGSRNASAAGLGFTERLAKDLGKAGFTIVSGFARGIDTRAHIASLENGTVAVLAGGHARIYPSENDPLADRVVASGGALVTEMPLEWNPRGRDFPRRNRIVSGLAYGVVVVEGALRSGSLITAKLALDQGREVFAVPGSPLDPRAEGPNALIREGATLCTKADDICSVLAPLIAKDDYFSATHPCRVDMGDLFTPLEKDVRRTNSEPRPVQGRTEPELSQEEHIMSLLGPTPVAVDELVRLSGVPFRVTQSILLELELDGKLMRHPGNAVSLV